MAVDVHGTTLGLDHRKLAMWTFLGSEFLFFGAFIATFLLYVQITATGPGVEIFDIPFTTISSFVLLMSSLTMVLAHHAHTRGDMRRVRLWLVATAGQGAVFLGGQVFEFNVFWREGLDFTAAPFASAFYVLTGFHGIHVFVGILLLLGLYSLTLTGKVTMPYKRDAVGQRVARVPACARCNHLDRATRTSSARPSPSPNPEACVRTTVVIDWSVPQRRESTGAARRASGPIELQDRAVLLTPGECRVKRALPMNRGAAAPSACSRSRRRASPQCRRRGAPSSSPPHRGSAGSPLRPAASRTASTIVW